LIQAWEIELTRRGGKGSPRRLDFPRKKGTTDHQRGNQNLKETGKKRKLSLDAILGQESFSWSAAKTSVLKRKGYGNHPEGETFIFPIGRGRKKFLGTDGLSWVFA